MKRLLTVLCTLIILSQPLMAKRRYQRRFGSQNRVVSVKKTPPQQPMTRSRTQRPTAHEYRTYRSAQQPKKHAKIDRPRFTINV
jgi:hypothetical protein